MSEKHGDRLARYIQDERDEAIELVVRFAPYQEIFNALELPGYVFLAAWDNAMVHLSRLKLGDYADIEAEIHAHFNVTAVFEKPYLNWTTSSCPPEPAPHIDHTFYIDDPFNDDETTGIIVEVKEPRPLDEYTGDFEPSR